MELEKLSEKDLAELLEKAEKRLEKLRSRPSKADMLAAIEKIAEENGYTLAELFPSAAPSPRVGSKKLGKAKVKYVHPTNPELRWSGRGSKPKWIVELLAAGHRLEDLSLSLRGGQAN